MTSPDHLRTACWKEKSDPHSNSYLMNVMETLYPLIVTSPQIVIPLSLKEKHPKPLNPMTIIRPEDCPNDHHPVIFESLNGQLIHHTALKTNGSAGPSGVDSAGWRRLCSSFQYASKELCSALAAVARRICTSYVDPNSLKAFVASRLIALNKCPGIRPIGVGKVVRRIIGKAILTVISEDIQTAAGS